MLEQEEKELPRMSSGRYLSVNHGLEARTASTLDFLSVTVDGKMPGSQQIPAIRCF